MKFRALLIAALLLFGAEADAAKKRKVDPVALARVLLLDGLANRAIAVLAEVPLDDPEVDLKELYRLRGLAENELGLYQAAVESFRKAIQHGETSPGTWYALVNAQFSAGEHQGVLDSLAAAPTAVFALPGAHRLKAFAYYNLQDRYRAFAAADLGFQRFPKELELERLRVLLLLELGLSQEGLAAANHLFERPEIGPKDFLALGAALASARDSERAALLLEAALLRFPEDQEVREQLARVYYEADRPLLAAQVIHPLALEDSRMALLAAELYARAGKVDQALRMNARVLEQTKKIRQRLTILIEAQRFHEAAALHQRAARLGLLEDEHQLYALAYAHYISGDNEEVESLLGQVSDPELFSKAVALRTALDACRTDVWKCD